MVREVEVQRLFDHPNIMPILDAADDRSWFVMPLAQGNIEELWSSGRCSRTRKVSVLGTLRMSVLWC